VRLSIIFAEHLSLAVLPPFHVASFRADGVLYRANEADDPLYFHDRLLDAAGQVAGILLWCFPSDGIDAALSAAGPPLRSYLVRYEHSPTVTIYEVYFRALTPTQADALESDGAQSFGGQIFRSPGGGLAITVELNDLLDAESEGEGDLSRMLASAEYWPVITDLARFPVAEA
jgi:hypothetical protein